MTLSEKWAETWLHFQEIFHVWFPRYTPPQPDQWELEWDRGSWRGSRDAVTIPLQFNKIKRGFPG